MGLESPQTIRFAAVLFGVGGILPFAVRALIWPRRLWPAVAAEDKFPRYPTMPRSQAVAEEYRALGHGGDDLHPPPHLTALCFSGGGIRSATFGLGIVQGLAKRGALAQFDYLSTVSGGGYLGSWLTAWIYRDRQGIQGVSTALHARRLSKVDAEVAPLKNLRDYSSYLTPRWGLLTADTWTWVAIYLRNLLLNWLVLLPLLGAVLLLPRLVVALTRMHPLEMIRLSQPGSLDGGAAVLPAGLLAIGSILAIWAMSYGSLALWAKSDWKYAHAFKLCCLLPLLGSALTLSLGWAWWQNAHPTQQLTSLPSFIGFGLVVHTLGCLFGGLGKRLTGTWVDGRQSSPFDVLRRGVLALIAGAVGGALIGCAARSSWFSQPGDQSGYYVSFAAPLLLVLFFIATSLYAGFFSRDTSDAQREWWARAGAWTLIVAVVWSVGSWLVLYGLERFVALGTLAKTVLGGVGGIAGVVTLFLGQSAGTAALADEKAKPGWAEMLKAHALTIAPALFIVVVVVVLSFATNWLIVVVTRMVSAGEGIVACPAPLSSTDYLFCTDQSILRQLLHEPDEFLPSSFLFLLGVAVGLAWISFRMGRSVNINKFSLHAAYRDRLIRAYLGASRPDRRPHGFTGFDSDDNLQMYELHPALLRPSSFVDLDQFLAKFQRNTGPISVACRNQLKQTNPELLQQLAKHSGSPTQPNNDGLAFLAALNRLLLKEHFASIKPAQPTSRPGARTPTSPDEDPPAAKYLYDNRLLFEQEYPTDIKPLPDSIPKPLHIVNIALNLVKGENLAWQERKADSFTVSPLHAGNLRLGYRNVYAYGGKKDLDGGNGISLGTALTISGAAVSPNQGYHSSPLVSFLLALFNIRLGWWLGNPSPFGDRTYRLRGPEFAVGPLIAETFALTDKDNRYVYLSDGGHFDNLGLYEMVLRRCRLIIVSDAGQDPRCELADLGSAMRKIRTDLGVPIVFDDWDIHARQEQKAGKRFAVATIRYSDVDPTNPSDDGVLLYLKPALYDDEPTDVKNYAKEHPDFPHDTTADQWFNESQFESYRALGFFTIEKVMEEISQQDLAQFTLSGLVRELRAYAVRGGRTVVF